MKRFSALIAILVVAGCGGDISPKGKSPGLSINAGTNQGTGGDAGAQPDSGPTDDDGGVNLPDGSMSSEDAPQIIELTASPTRITETTRTTLSAVVTDPQGSDDVVAVRLLEQSSSAALGNFAADGGGAYSISVSWNDLQNNIDIRFDGSMSVILTAEAIDSGGERSTRSLSLRLECSEAMSACGGTCGQTSCAGACVDEGDLAGDNDNCGACGNACSGRDICSGDECVDPVFATGACTSDSDCGGIAGSCGTEADSGVPGGICLILCSRDGCGPGQECVGLQDRSGQTIPICFGTCTTNDDCRDSFECQDAGNARVCVPVL